MPRTPIRGVEDEDGDAVAADVGPMDASLLPPG